ncbi:MAG TPA: 2'-5' RNA ligase family protein [Spirochaetia bacterium]|nr:2'-5' RNA ligase family protein [Spirochaetia bacterium]
MNGLVRFIIITTTPPDVDSRLKDVRRRINEIGACRAALAYPPHVTLRTGALVPAELVSRFLDSLGAVVGRWTPFPIRTDGLWQTSYRDRDREKYLVGYRIVKDAALSELNERLLRCTSWRASDRLHFEPHLTLAFDDLERDGYQRVCQWLRENPGALPGELEWICDNVGVYVKEEEQWVPYKVWRE